MKKIKILLIGMTGNLGGIETYIYNLVKYSDKNSFQFDSLSMGNENIAYEEELKKIGCNIFKITPIQNNYKKHVKELKNILIQNNYDFIHYSVMTLGWCEPIILANKYTKSKIIVHSHNAGFDKNINWKIKLMHKIGELRTRKIPYLKVACGDDAAKFMFKGKDYTIFYNAIDLEKYKFNQKNREQIRNELKIDTKKTIIGLTARLERQKNVLFLIDIFNEILKLDENVVLVLTGDGSLRDEIKQKIAYYNISEKVILMGKRKDAYKIYSAYDIFLMPSLYEGLSISLIEAQVNGLKCYTSNTVDKKSNITGNIEFLSLEKSPKEWAEYIIAENNNRDNDVLKKIPIEFNANKSYEKVLEFYKQNIEK